MGISRRVVAILAVVALLSLTAGPASADDGLVEVGLNGRVVQLVADRDGTCALTEAGEVFCWGADYPEQHNPMGLAALGALLIAVGACLLVVSRRRS